MQFYLCLYSLGQLLTKTKISWSDSLVVLMSSMMSFWRRALAPLPIYLEDQKIKKKKNHSLLGTVFVID